MKKIITVIGTRPEIIKMSQLIKELDKNFKQILIFSGQHYDKNMVDFFFKDFDLRKPDILLKIKKKKNFFFEFGIKLKKIIEQNNPKAIIYHGDTYTTLTAGLISHFFFPKIVNIHIEGGYRSQGKIFIEDKIRTVVDKLSKINFVSRLQEKKNLLKEGVKKKIFVVGNTIVDALDNAKLKKNFFFNKKEDYIYVTIHRSENVDNKKRLAKIFLFLNSLSKKIKVIVSLHPRTKKKISLYKIKILKNIIFFLPLKYSDNINILKNSFFCITDSGGLQEEAILLKKKCFIPGRSTPHLNYLNKNANELINLNITKFKKKLNFLLRKKKIKIREYFHQKKVSFKICQIIKKEI